MILRELVQYRGDLEVVFSRPCVYGVFSGPVGGFWPRQRLCVGCLRCTVQYPDIVQIHPNPERARLGDSYVTPDQVDTVLYEASTGRVPVRGAGYRGRFGGEGWDALWTDMSEIVRPTRDGIHGREFISTSVDVGERPDSLEFDSLGGSVGQLPRSVPLPLPMLFDLPPLRSQQPFWYAAACAAAERLGTYALVPLRELLGVPHLAKGGAAFLADDDWRSLIDAGIRFPLVELDGWNEAAFRGLRSAFPESQVLVRLPYGAPLRDLFEHGVRVFHLIADYHGRTPRGFVMQAALEAHRELVDAGVREQVTLIGSGGIVAAEHVPKAVIAGLDAVALDSALWIALQAAFVGEVQDRRTAEIEWSVRDVPWADARLGNLVAAWRDQLLEVLGAMGLREVRRLRGEVGRAMIQSEVEREAFAGIPGYPSTGSLP
jgi:hypothetical protein